MATINLFTTSSIENQSDEPENVGPETAILFVVVSLAIGAIFRQILHKTRIPYTVALLVTGMGLGAMEYGTHRGLGSLGQSIRLWSNIHPNLILYVFLPALLFESSFSMEIHQIKRCFQQMLLLAGPGVIISTVCLGLVHHFIFPYGWSWSISLLLGGLLSATDPVAVVSLLKDVQASKKLSTIIEGESLMNDGTAMVVFELFYQMVLGKHFTAGEMVKFLFQVALGAVALGLAFGMVSVFWLGFMFNDTVMEITLTFTASYCAFFVAQQAAEVSGVLAVMTVGIFLAAFARTAFKGESQQSMHCFWTIVAYFANTVIFILSGVVIVESFLRTQSLIEARDWGYLLILYISLQLSRAIVVIVLYPGLRYYGYGLSIKEAIVLIWAGLRGAVALALALSVELHETQPGGGVPEETQAKFVFFTGGVVFLTLIVNGSSTRFVLEFLRMEKTNETKRLVVEHVKQEMITRAREAFDELGDDEELGPADWQTIKNYIGSLNHILPHEPMLGGHKQQLQDTRLRFLNGVQSAYWEMLEEGRITQTAALILMQSVDEALDKVADEHPLEDWIGLHPHVHFPTYLKHLQAGNFCLPQRLLTYLIVERLELGCYISAAFLRAHLLVRRQLRTFIGETDISELVIKESEEESGEAKRFLEGIRLTFSQVLRVVKTKQVAHAILLRLSDYIQSLVKSGLLEDKETIHLHDAVQADLKKLLRNPPGVKMPKGVDVLSVHPFVTSLPAELQSLILNSAREFMKLRGSFIYKQGARASGIWLIANGIVKWTNRENNRHLLHPTFPHGSTLGLYEVFMGKTFMCDLIADSVVQCFFVDSSKILSALRSNPELENMIWQECTLPVAKIFLPDVFETVPMNELRAAVQTSTIDSFIRGEDVEISPGEVGLLLEGFLKQEGMSDIISAPAGIMYHSGESGLKHPQAGVWFGNLFHVETRCRLLVLSPSFSSSQALLASRRSSLGRDSFIARHRGARRRRSLENLGILKQDPAAKTSEEQSLLSNMEKSELKRVSTGSTRSNSQLRRKGSLPDIPAGPSAPLPSVRTRGLHRRPKLTRNSDSDDDASDGEEEHIIEIESPSSLFRSSFHSGNISS